MADNLGPFEPERYFDGQRVRTLRSADELAAHYLQPLGLDRSRCWITDLVKVFLFKAGHREKYERLGQASPPGYERERFAELARCSLFWVEREIQLARPRLLISLGAEVAGVLRNVRGQRRLNALLSPSVSTLSVGTARVRAVHLAHPGIVMRGGTAGRNPWPERHAQHVAQLVADGL